MPKTPATPFKRFYRVWGVLPVFARKSRDEYGHADGVIIQLPEGFTPAMLAHELHHVKQFYVMLMIYMIVGGIMGRVLEWFQYNLSGWAIAILGFIFLQVWERSKWVNWRCETAAYGVSCRVAGKEWITHYAKKLVSDPAYNLGRSFPDAVAQITKRYEDGRLF